MRNAGLDEFQDEIKIGRRNINNLRYANYITLMAEGEEELKSLLMKVKEESKNVGCLIPGFSSFSKPSLEIWKFLVHIMLKPGMQNFKHDLASMGRRRHWHPTPVLLPGKSHGQRSLLGCSPWGR